MFIISVNAVGFVGAVGLIRTQAMVYLEVFLTTFIYFAYDPEQDRKQHSSNVNIHQAGLDFALEGVSESRSDMSFRGASNDSRFRHV